MLKCMTAQLQCHIASCGALYSNYSCQMPAAVSSLVSAADVQFTSEYWQTMQATLTDVKMTMNVIHVTCPRKLQVSPAVL